MPAACSHTCVNDHLLQEAQESASTAHRAAMCFSCLGLQSSTFDTYQEVKLLATSLAWLNMTCCTVIWLLHPQSACQLLDLHRCTEQTSHPRDAQEGE